MPLFLQVISLFSPVAIKIFSLSLLFFYFTLVDLDIHDTLCSLNLHKFGDTLATVIIYSVDCALGKSKFQIIQGLYALELELTMMFEELRHYQGPVAKSGVHEGQ